MRYSSSVWMKGINALSEFVLIMAAYVLSGALRAVIPFGKDYSMADTWVFLPVGLIYAVVLVCGYAFIGCYHTLRYYSFRKELVKIAFVDLAGCIIVASVLYIFRLDQFSRILLGLFLGCSSGIVLVKRVIFSRISERYAEIFHLDDYIIVWGDGNYAQKFYQQVLKNEQKSWKWGGYLSDTENERMSGYLGKKESLRSVLAEQKIDRIVIVEEAQSRDEIKYVIAVAADYKVKVSIIPAFHDYLSSKEKVHFVNGFKLLDLEMLDVNNIMGVNIAVTNMEKTLDLIETKLEQWRGQYICVANVHTTVTSHDDKSYRDIQNQAVIALPDGGPLSSFSRELQYMDAERVTGPDLMQEILRVSADKGWKNYFYGSTEATLEKMLANIKERYPGDIVAGAYSPPFRQLTEKEDKEVIRMINEARPDFVWVGLGAPKQEIWMHAHRDKIQALMVGVGAAFDYEAGNIDRAPEWMQKHNLEWMYRLVQNPKRLFKRYLVTNTKFLMWKWRQ